MFTLLLPCRQLGSDGIKLLLEQLKKKKEREKRKRFFFLLFLFNHCTKQHSKQVFLTYKKAEKRQDIDSWHKWIIYETGDATEKNPGQLFCLSEVRPDQYSPIKLGGVVFFHFFLTPLPHLLNFQGSDGISLSVTVENISKPCQNSKVRHIVWAYYSVRKCCRQLSYIRGGNCSNYDLLTLKGS